MKIRGMSPLEYLGAQLLYTSPATAPVWLAGLFYLLLAPAAKPFRVLAIAYLAILALLMAQQGKAYYLAPAYPMLYGAGGVAFERLTARRGWRRLRPMLVVILALLGLAGVPMAIPVLPPEDVVRYAAAIGIDAPQEERQRRVALSQHLADRFGWESMAATIARVYNAVPPEERARTAIFAGNYGEAGAIDLFGARYGLPKAISSHNNYWLWGPRDGHADLAIVFGVPRQRLEEICGEVTHADTIVSPYAMAYETDLPVYICHRFKRPLPAIWPELKRYI
jgi:hypothetical protein